MVLKALQSTSYNGSTSSERRAESMGSEETARLKLKPSQFSKDRVVPGTSMSTVMTELGQWTGQQVGVVYSQIEHLYTAKCLLTVCRFNIVFICCDSFTAWRCSDAWKWVWSGLIIIRPEGFSVSAHISCC